MSLPSGDAIEIEERTPREVTHVGGVQITPDGIGILNTAFDVTPHQYVTAIITERGVAREPYTQSLGEIMEAVSV
jgi:methylthioribose-1-phosphate isomerase